MTEQSSTAQFQVGAEAPDSAVAGALCPVVYTDSQGERWTVADEFGRFLEDSNGERFTFAWVEDHFGPLSPEARSAWECKCGRGFDGIRAYRLHFRRCQNLPSAQRKVATDGT